MYYCSPTCELKAIEIIWEDGTWEDKKNTQKLPTDVLRYNSL